MWKNCVECGVSFPVMEDWQKFCSRMCTRNHDLKRINEIENESVPEPVSSISPKSIYQKKPSQRKNCIECSKEFWTKGGIIQKFCRQGCSRKWHLREMNRKFKEKREAKLQEGGRYRSCAICGTVFSYVADNAKYCSNPCRAEAQLRQLEESNRRYKQAKEERKSKPVDHLAIKSDCEVVPHSEKPRGKYVYGWFNPGDTLPFYIGKGIGNRAWELHTSGKKSVGGAKVNAFCEVLRSRNTVVKIFRSRLTDEGALLIESILIDLFRSIGAVMTNQNNGMGRPEIPPLEV